MLSDIYIFLFADDSVYGAKKVEDERSPSPAEVQSPVIDRNPSPPPDTADGEEGEDLDAIGETIYSKHWLFSTLTRLINVSNLLSQPDPSNLTQQ